MMEVEKKAKNKVAFIKKVLDAKSAQQPSRKEEMNKILGNIKRESPEVILEDFGSFKAHGIEPEFHFLGFTLFLSAAKKKGRDYRS